MKNLHTLGILAAALLMLSSCTKDIVYPNANQNLSNTNATSNPTIDGIGYRNTEFDFSLTLPGDLASSNSSSTYLLPDSWSALDAGTGSGRKLTSFTLDGSNQIIAAGIRVGTSRGVQEVQSCLSGPTYATSVMRTEEINGNTFKIIDLSDAAMSKYSNVSSYRIVRDNTCFVFDTFVSGTNPEVYENPPRPAFSKDEAFAKLQATMRTLKFGE